MPTRSRRRWTSSEPPGGHRRLLRWRISRRRPSAVPVERRLLPLRGSEAARLPARRGTQYCNGCYVVLGAIIERVTGVRYEDYIAERVFKAAGMAGAGFLQSDRFPRQRGDRVHAGVAEGGGALVSNEEMHGVGRQRRRRRVCDSGRPAGFRQRPARAPAGGCEDDSLDPRRRHGAVRTAGDGRHRHRWRRTGLQCEHGVRRPVDGRRHREPGSAQRYAGGGGDQPSVDAVTIGSVSTSVTSGRGAGGRGEALRVSHPDRRRRRRGCRDADRLPRARGYEVAVARDGPTRSRAGTAGRRRPRGAGLDAAGAQRPRSVPPAAGRVGRADPDADRQDVGGRPRPGPRGRGRRLRAQAVQPARSGGAHPGAAAAGGRRAPQARRSSRCGSAIWRWTAGGARYGWPATAWR